MDKAMVNPPRLLVAAPGSGSGKTTVTCAILQGLLLQGETAASFKCGPDYIDPMFHRQVLGVPCHNLDLFFSTQDQVRQLLYLHSRGRAWSILEGVMGYYDGVGLTTQGSSFHLSQATKTPTVLVVDGRGMAASLGALVEGYLRFVPDSGIAGVILNRVSPALYPRLKGLLEERLPVRVLGYLPSNPGYGFTSRHLGLVTAEELGDVRHRLELLGRQAQETLDWDGLRRLACGAAPFRAQDSFGEEPGAPVRIAVARDRAFCFYYQDSLELLERLGAELVFFRPLEDEPLPEAACGLLLGGGYPEVYARQLAAAETAKRSIRAALAAGLPCIAECGGFQYLQSRLEGEDGALYPMCGVLDSTSRNTGRLCRFGYQQLTAREDSLLCRRGERLPAHEFHYWDSTDNGDGFEIAKASGKGCWTGVHATPNLYAGYPHLYLPAAPQAARRFLERCRRWAAEKGEKR